MPGASAAEWALTNWTDAQVTTKISLTGINTLTDALVAE